jgi:hypothetical protein
VLVSPGFAKVRANGRAAPPYPSRVQGSLPDGRDYQLVYGLSS